MGFEGVGCVFGMVNRWVREWAMVSFACLSSWILLNFTCVVIIEVWYG